MLCAVLCVSVRDVDKTMLTKLRRSFRRKRASYCVNCGHVEKACYHQEYENVEFHAAATPSSVGGSLNNQNNNQGGGTMVAHDLKWLDLQAHRQRTKKILNADANNSAAAADVYYSNACTASDPYEEAIYSVPQV